MSLRLKYGLWFIGSIVIGLLSRSNRMDLPQIIHDNLGDIIWGGMVYFLIGIFLHKTRRIRKVLTALGLSFSVELSQLIKAEWFDSLRNIPGMKLFFGEGFQFSDLICYAMGIGIALVLDKLFIHKKEETTKLEKLQKFVKKNQSK